MHLRRLQISNFRALENIDVEFTALVNVIIGPNAIGKTTILEAIRLAKGLLAPRIQNESQQTLFQLGLLSPHMPQRLLPSAITNDPSRPTVVKCSFRAEPEEISLLEALLPSMIPNFALQSMGQRFADAAQAMNFLNSPMGQQGLQAAQRALTEELTRLKGSSSIDLNLTIHHATPSINGEFPVRQLMYTTLEQQLDPTKAMFSYFPADRAMPIGEQPVQLGLADTSQQLESYNSQPQLKYNRLKNMIFNTIIGRASGRDELAKQFDLIFQRVLKGRSLGEIGVNNIGMLSIPIRDTETNESFDIDGLSSGEKGLILTSLLISRNIEKNGLVLLDEPELHLNPAVCRDLLQFYVDEFAIKNNMQAIVCSHSAEILAGAFERNECALFHLRSGTSLAKVRQQDQGEIRDALRRLGSSESEALLYRGTLSVEGIHDIEILQAGFDAIVRRLKVKQLGGRGVLESDIRELQTAERNGVEIGLHYFLFDHDRQPTSLTDSTHVRLRQLKRFCLENYLLEPEIITDLSREKEFADSPLQNVTETTQKMKALAMEQLNSVAAREVFKQFELESICFDMKQLDRDAGNAAPALLSQIGLIVSKLSGFKPGEFEVEYRKRFDAKVAELAARWDDKWRDQCDGKRLLEDMRRDKYIKGDLLKLKRRIAIEMRLRSTEAYNALTGILTDLIASAPAM
ncbi:MULTISPECIES: AAA family ATPase [unclassified Bradyrhizobium]|uniref:ATP-dependent nuclease n=1 Tax=unclassified Bradyrhizobium TaxID=2631580 RepID=UPI001CD60EAB|nr:MULTISPECIES: AAA family ATPase [unclassified Bradyrhizobium]MCA1376225.1 AAA family ATPase [Bradyrhizobium sp. IC4060]MCA1482950.1 AAA family ATPase [Bradyrhizobium sp. IC4061]